MPDVDDLTPDAVLTLRSIVRGLLATGRANGLPVEPDDDGVNAVISLIEEGMVKIVTNEEHSVFALAVTDEGRRELLEGGGKC